MLDLKSTAEVLNSHEDVIFVGRILEIVKWVSNTALDPNLYSIRVNKEKFPLGEFVAHYKNERRKHVIRYVKDAMCKQDIATYYGDSTNGVKGVADDIADQIIGLFQ